MTDSATPATPERQHQLQAPVVPPAQVPPPPSWSAPGHAAASPPLPPTAPPPATASSWFWCPECHVASSRTGTCPSCQQPFVPAPPEGLPYGPYKPADRTRRAGTVVSTLSVLLTVIPLLAAAAIGFWLFKSGTPATTAAANDGLLNSTTQTTTQRLPLLGTVKLPGTWTPDATLESNLDSDLNSNGGQATILLAIRSNQTSIWMASISKFPSGEGSSSQCTSTPISNSSPILAGRHAERDDFKYACPDGTEYISQYAMTDNGATLVLKIISPDSSASFDKIGNALLTLPNSGAGGISL